MIVAIYEFIGTMLLTFACIISGGDLMAISLTFFSLLQILGPVSGAHVNPAVTLGVYIREGQIENKEALFKMIIAQFIGAIAGAVMAINSLASDSKVWRQVHPNSEVPLEWMPTVCPVDPISGLCVSASNKTA